jgi:hypothetical protein
MLSIVILPLVVGLNTHAPSLHDIQTAHAQVNIIRAAMEHRTEFIAGAPRKGPGPDHGGDPHDEKHDGGIPGNAHAGDGYPSGDPYNDSTPNNKDSPNRPY